MPFRHARSSAVTSLGVAGTRVPPDGLNTWLVGDLQQREVEER